MVEERGREELWPGRNNSVTGSHWEPGSPGYFRTPSFSEQLLLEQMLSPVELEVFTGELCCWHTALSSPVSLRSVLGEEPPKCVVHFGSVPHTLFWLCFYLLRIVPTQYFVGGLMKRQRERECCVLVQKWTWQDQFSAGVRASKQLKF